VLAGACAQIIGIEDLPPLPVDATGPSGFAVGGTATGVLGPVALELRLGNDVELLSVTRDEPFAFETRLESGASYTVVFADPEVLCMLRNQTGVIAGADTAIELTCTGASLANVFVSGVAPAVTLVPGTTDYVVDLPLLQQSVTLTVTVAVAGDTLRIAGATVASGTPSAELTLSLGDNPVDIVVENVLGWQRTYRLTLHRAAQLAQYAYGKASNTGDDDYFGYSVALSGDTLAVGAAYEDSAGRGVDGNQAGNAASNSGAVYVFRRAGTAWQQEAYLKASNTGADDYFGGVALSVDTLAVATNHEDSEAQGVDGNQDDNGATDSGAVYIFH
jgi:trimeric autotransporter adhesin